MILECRGLSEGFSAGTCLFEGGSVDHTESVATTRLVLDWLFRVLGKNTHGMDGELT